jgi:uncharacterized protein YcbK (DUF882 family)
MEEILGFEVVALSVCRCEKHNQAEGGEDKSHHLATPAHDCCAVDVESPDTDMDTRLKIAKAAEVAGFRGFGYARTFLHIDMGRKRFWFYPGFLTRHPALCPWKNPAETTQ